MSVPSVFVQGNDYHVEIPRRESASATHPGPARRRNGTTRKEKNLPLDGRTYEEVLGEASRIQVGSGFESFQEFDRCMDSWAVIHRRSVARYKTTSNIAIRNCRFGRVHKRSSRKDCPHSGIPSGPDLPHSRDSGEWDSEDDLPDKEAGAEERSEMSDSDEGQENCPVPLSEDQVEEICFQKSITSMATSIRARQPFSSLASRENVLSQQKTNPAPATQVGILAQQKNSLVSATQAGAMTRRPPSVVKHTSVWLSGKRSTLLGDATEKPQRKKSATGACGQLRRLRPGPEEDFDDFYTSEPCPFHVRAIKRARSGAIVIRKCQLKHNCPQQLHRWRGPTSKAPWLGETLAPRVVRNLKGTVRELSIGFQQDYKRTTSCKQMWRAKDLVRDAYLGGQRQSYHLIPGLIDRLRATDPGCKAFWDSFDDNSRTFQRAFVCPAATRDALSYCQPVVSLDACHTKNRKFPTQLFLATVLDGNMQILPLAYGVAPTENLENWLWFLHHLDASIKGIEDVIIPFISDRCKGLLGAVKDVFPGKVHGMCAQHLRANVKTLFGKAAEGFFLATVYANTRDLFQAILERLTQSVAKGQAASEYISKLEPSLYARFAFPLPRFGKVTSNPCEATNSGLLPIREFAPFKLLVEMWYYIQSHFNDSRKAAAASKESLTEPALRRFNENLSSFGQFQVFDDCGGTAKVQTTTGSEEYLVSLVGKPSCTCFKLQEMQWPCEHVMAWDEHSDKSFHRHFHPCWKVSSWRSLYAHIVPSFICNDIAISSECWPPEQARTRGRHRVVRIRSGSRVNRALQGEDVVADHLGNVFIQYPINDDANLLDGMPTQATVAGRQNETTTTQQRKKAGPKSGKNACGKCGKCGHNRRTCKGPDATQPPDAEPQGVQEIVEELATTDVGADDALMDGLIAEFRNADQYLEYTDNLERFHGLDQVDPRPAEVPRYMTSDAEDWSSEEDRDIRMPQFGSTQNPQSPPDYAPFNYEGNICGLSQVQRCLDP